MARYPRIFGIQLFPEPVSQEVDRKDEKRQNEARDISRSTKSPYRGTCSLRNQHAKRRHRQRDADAQETEGGFKDDDHGKINRGDNEQDGHGVG